MVLVDMLTPNVCAGGWLKKNLYYEENAGIRENSTKIFKVNAKSLRMLFAFLILPSSLMYMAMANENVSNDLTTLTSFYVSILILRLNSLNRK